jgi:hypothetical protein
MSPWFSVLHSRIAALRYIKPAGPSFVPAARTSAVFTKVQACQRGHHGFLRYLVVACEAAGSPSDAGERGVAFEPHGEFARPQEDPGPSLFANGSKRSLPALLMSGVLKVGPEAVIHRPGRFSRQSGLAKYAKAMEPALRTPIVSPEYIRVGFWAVRSQPTCRCNNPQEWNWSSI